MQTPLTVSTLNNQIKSLLETHYLSVMVQAEVSRVTYHTSGHLYFSLKDSSSSISCVMFKGNNQRLKFRVEEGMEVIVSGGISVYSPRGTYQINCTSMEPSGSGALALAYEQLKEKLYQKGYFEADRKKTLPKFVKKIALVTSETGAAIEDMKRVAAKRWPLVELILIDTTVQGEKAASMIAQNIAIADSLGVDIIVVGRGGGSIEDLWAFNEEIVADAIYNANTPIVSAVGHEIDTVISDYCSDLRAPTPSAAMEMILPDISEMQIYLDGLLNQYEHSMLRVINEHSQTLKHLQSSFNQHSFERKIEYSMDEVKAIKERFDSYMDMLFAKKSRNISDLLDLFSHNNPKNRDKLGFAQILKDGKKADLSLIKVDDEIDILDSKVKIRAKVRSIEPSE
jgi:exodeoxyribonuclease VII large subunit